jgi:hypothetical protein
MQSFSLYDMSQASTERRAKVASGRVPPFCGGAGNAAATARRIDRVETGKLAQTGEMSDVAAVEEGMQEEDVISGRSLINAEIYFFWIYI